MIWEFGRFLDLNFRSLCCKSEGGESLNSCPMNVQSPPEILW